MKVNLQQARAPPLTSELDLLDLRYTGSGSTPTLIRVATTYKDPQSYTRNIMTLLPSVLLWVCSISNNANGNKQAIFWCGYCNFILPSWAARLPGRICLMKIPKSFSKSEATFLPPTTRMPSPLWQPLMTICWACFLFLTVVGESVTWDYFSKATLLTQPYKDNLQPTMLSTDIVFNSV